MSKFIIDLDKDKKYNNILFVRSPTTGEFFDKILKDDERVMRIVYETGKISAPYHESTISINHDELEVVIYSLNKKFDLICIDSYHEYKYSKDDFFLLYRYLSNDGIMISHDCFPLSKDIANEKYKSGEWSGETYIAFIEFSYIFRDLYYGLLNVDTGIGIASKFPHEFLSNKLDRTKQRELLRLYNTTKNNVYEYFFYNAKEMINLIEY